MFERRRFLIDWFANLLSLSLLAISGLLINGLIAKHYGPETLGIFNTVFAFYILASQVGTLGVQYSVLRYIPGAGEQTVGMILTAGVVVAAVASLVLVIASAFLFVTVGTFIYGEAVAAGIIVMLPGLSCFSINKVLLNALNALQRNRFLAAFTALRYLMMSICTVALVLARVPDYQLCAILSISEVVLLIGLLICFLGKLISLRDLRLDRGWLRRHVEFGSRSLLGGVAVELNTRVDILVLGLFTTEAQVGIYSFAAFVVEGILQLPQISRRLVDPVIAKLAADRQLDALDRFLRKGRNVGAVAAIIVTTVALGLYPLAAKALSDEALATASYPVFSILMLGACIFSVYGTFAGLLSQSGFPGSQSRYNGMVLGTNLVLNLALAPKFGIYGAAFATASSFVIGTFYFRNQVFQRLRIRI